MLNMCPETQARWCVISRHEMRKCENMIMAFAAKNLKPDLNCILGQSARDCMEKIRQGDADLITLDAADVYVAGKSVAPPPSRTSPLSCRVPHLRPTSNVVGKSAGRSPSCPPAPTPPLSTSTSLGSQSPPVAPSRPHPSPLDVYVAGKLIVFV